MTTVLERPIYGPANPDHSDDVDVDRLLAELSALHEEVPSRTPTAHDMHVGQAAVSSLGELQQAAHDASQHEQAVADLREIQDSAPVEVH